MFKLYFKLKACKMSENFHVRIPRLCEFLPENYLA